MSLCKGPIYRKYSNQNHLLCYIPNPKCLTTLFHVSNLICQLWFAQIICHWTLPESPVRSIVISRDERNMPLCSSSPDLSLGGAECCRVLRGPQSSSSKRSSNLWRITAGVDITRQPANKENSFVSKWNRETFT